MSEKPIGYFSQLFHPKPPGLRGMSPDQTGKIVVVTDGNNGIGKGTAKVLLSKGAKVYIAARSEEKSFHITRHSILSLRGNMGVV